MDMTNCEDLCCCSFAAQGEEWKKTTLKTALLFPGVVFCIFFALNLLVWGQRSSGAVPFGTLFALCFLWFGISVPLVFIGSYFGYKKPPPEVRNTLTQCACQTRRSRLKHQCTAVHGLVVRDSVVSGFPGLFGGCCTHSV